MRINIKRKDLMIMGHTPYGYRIENGKAIIDEPAATKIRTLYTNATKKPIKIRTYLIPIVSS